MLPWSVFHGQAAHPYYGPILEGLRAQVSGSGRTWISTWDFRGNKKSPLSHTELFCSHILYWIWDAYELWTYKWILFKEDASTGWSKSEREKQILYINPYMWNIEKRYRWSSVQSRNTDIEVENKHMDAKGERTGRDELRDWDWYTHSYVYNRERIRTYCIVQGTLVHTQGDLNG